MVLANPTQGKSPAKNACVILANPKNTTYLHCVCTCGFVQLYVRTPLALTR